MSFSFPLTIPSALVFFGAILVAIGIFWTSSEEKKKVKGKWTYLYRAIDKRGHTIDFYLSPTRNTQAARRFLGKALKSIKLKRLINPVRGFKSMKTAYATIKGFELMRMFKKRQMDVWKYRQGLIGGINLIERQSDIYAT